MLRQLVSHAFAACLLVPSLAGAQVKVLTPAPAARKLAVSLAGDRPTLGLLTSSGGMRDTLGLLVTGITTGSPAEKAGLEEGNRIIAINGVNLRLAAADAKEPDMAGVLGRRFQRELDKIKAGDEVDLRVYAEGQTRSVKVKSVRADELRGERSFTRVTTTDDRPTIGASVGGLPSPRDTIGVFVVAVAEDGPLAKAGVFEGSRIASINGVDLRVPAADAGDDFMTSSRVRRLTREIEKLEPGANAELRVYSNGQLRTVTVAVVKRSDLKSNSTMTIFKSGGPMGVLMHGSDDLPIILDRMRMEMNHLMDGEARLRIEETLRHLRDTLRGVSDRARAAEDEARRRLEEAMKAIRSRSGSAGDAPTAAFAPMAKVGGFGAASQMIKPAVRTTVTAKRLETAPEQSAVFSVLGIGFSRIDAQLASYLGAGSENGLLVLEVDSRWSGIRPGDVLLAIDGRVVRIADSSRVALDDSLEHKVELMRDGKRITATLIGR